MASLLFALVATILMGFGGRDQLIVARLSDALGPSRALLAVALACAAISAGVMGWAGWQVEKMISDSAETMLVAIALFLAAIELLWPNREKPLKEPTRSLGAMSLVLLARQIGDGPRFLVFAVAAATASPLWAGIGGAIGGGAAIAIGWALGAKLEQRLPLRAFRAALGGVVLIVAVTIGLSARGLI